MRIYLAKSENPTKIRFINKFDVLNGVSKFCSVYHLVYRFVHCFYRLYPSVYQNMYQNIWYILQYVSKKGTYFDTYCICIKYFDTYFDTRRMCTKTCGVSNLVSNLADRVQWDVSKYVKYIFFNRKVNIRNAYYSRKYRINTILETCFYHKSWCWKHLIRLQIIFSCWLFWIAILLV